MYHIETSLEEILNECFPILLDSSMICSNIGILNYLCKIKNFNQLSRRKIRLEINFLDKFISLINHQNAATIKEVTAEFEVYFNTVRVSFNYLSDYEKDSLYNKKNRFNQEFKINYRNRSRLESIGKMKFKKNRILHAKLFEKTYLAYQGFKNSELDLSDYRYELLLEMIKLIEKPIGLKKDTLYKYGEHDKPKISSDTDEKLLAALYLQIMKYDQPILLTRDTDFYPLTGVSMSLLGSSTFLPFNQQFRDAVRCNPPLIGRPKENNYEITIFEDKFVDPFRIWKISNKESEQIKDHIVELWQNFSEVNELAHNPSLPQLN